MVYRHTLTDPYRHQHIDARVDDGMFDGLRRAMQTRLTDLLEGGEPLFTTAPLGTFSLWDVYLRSFPEGPERQYRNCHACRNFIERYAGLAVVEPETGKLIPALWSAGSCGFSVGAYSDAVNALEREVRRSRITGVFLSMTAKLGVPKTGLWEHLTVEVPQHILGAKRSFMHNPIADKETDFKVMRSTLGLYRIEVIRDALNLLEAEAVQRSEKFTAPVRFLLNVAEKRQALAGRNFINYLWRAVATAPRGFCRPTSSVTGTLLYDLAAGMPTDRAIRKFNDKLNPLVYQRPQAAPASGNVAQAERMFQEMGLAPALRRRYARLEEIPTDPTVSLWRPEPESPHTEMNAAVFGGLPTKDKSRLVQRDRSAPEVRMTWRKFSETILPLAKSIRYYAPATRRPYAAILTAVNPDAPPIIKWDSWEARNPFSWYLKHNGSVPAEWNLKSRTWVEVTAVITKPNMWGPVRAPDLGDSVMLVLKGCREASPAGGSSLCLFPEILLSEVRPIRSTLEAYSRQHHLGGREEASVCGLLLSSHTGGTYSWDAALEVEMDTGIRKIFLDRWD